MDTTKVLINSIPFLLLALFWVILFVYLRRYAGRLVKNGQPLAPGIFLQATPHYGHRIFLLRGLLWLFAGVAMLIVLTVLFTGDARFEGGPAGIIGFIPMSVGLAYLVFYRIEERRVRREGKDDSSKPSH